MILPAIALNSIPYKRLLFLTIEDVTGSVSETLMSLQPTESQPTPGVLTGGSTITKHKNIPDATSLDDVDTRSASDKMQSILNMWSSLKQHERYD